MINLAFTPAKMQLQHQHWPAVHGVQDCFTPLAFCTSKGKHPIDMLASRIHDYHVTQQATLRDCFFCVAAISMSEQACYQVSGWANVCVGYGSTETAVILEGQPSALWASFMQSM